MSDYVSRFERNDKLTDLAFITLPPLVAFLVIGGFAFAVISAGREDRRQIAACAAQHGAYVSSTCVDSSVVTVLPDRSSPSSR